MNVPDRQKLAGQKPDSLLPLVNWFSWGWHGLFIKGHTANQFMRFCLVGAGGVVVNTLVMWAAYDGLGLHEVISSILAFLVASVNNFAWNKIFTFKNQARGLKAVIGQYLRFLSVTLLGLAINLGVLVALVNWFGIDAVLANLAGVLLATFSNFIGNKLYAFR